MPTQAKAESIERFKARLAGTTAAVLTEYRGLTVRQLSELRKQLRAASAEYRVVKNRLARIALEGSPLASLRPHLTGPTAFVLGRQDAAAVARAVATFARANPAFQLRAAVIDGQLLEAAAIRTVAELPSRDTLRGQLVGAVQGPMAGLVGLLQAPQRQLVHVLAERGKGAGGEEPAG